MRASQLFYHFRLYAVQHKIKSHWVKSEVPLHGVRLSSYPRATHEIFASFVHLLRSFLCRFLPLPGKRYLIIGPDRGLMGPLHPRLATLLETMREMRMSTVNSFGVSMNACWARSKNENFGIWRSPPYVCCLMPNRGDVIKWFLRRKWFASLIIVSMDSSATKLTHQRMFYVADREKTPKNSSSLWLGCF